MDGTIGYQGFLMWLERGAMHAVAGLSFHAYKCPVALWLTTVNPGLRAEVSYVGVTYYRDGVTPVGAYLLDEILVEFLDRIDEVGQIGNGGLWSEEGNYYQVTYSQCKRVLHGILADAQEPGGLTDE